MRELRRGGLRGGFSLIELLVTMAIIAIIGLAAGVVTDAWLFMERQIRSELLKERNQTLNNRLVLVNKAIALIL